MAPVVVGVALDMALVARVVASVGFNDNGFNGFKEMVWLLHRLPLQHTILQSSKYQPWNELNQAVKILQPTATSVVMKEHQEIIILKNLSNKIVTQRKVSDLSNPSLMATLISLNLLQSGNYNGVKPNISVYLQNIRHREIEIIMRVPKGMD